VFVLGNGFLLVVHAVLYRVCGAYDRTRSGPVARQLWRALDAEQFSSTDNWPLTTPAVRKGGLPPLPGTVARQSWRFPGIHPKPPGESQPSTQNPLALLELYPERFAEFQREQITTLVQHIHLEALMDALALSLAGGAVYVIPGMAPGSAAAVR